MSRYAILSLLLIAPFTRPALVLAQAEPARARAAAHFDRGIDFFNEGRYDAALAELGRAFELAPEPAVLYNLARVHSALGNAVEAADAYERYLEHGAFDTARRREVTEALAEQRSRIGELMVESDVEGATVAVNGVDVATVPFVSPLRLRAGTHMVEVRAPGYESVRRSVSIAGEASRSIRVSLREAQLARGTLRIVTNPGDVEITVDQEAVGLTPLASTIALRAGEHTVEARRAGYRVQRQRISIEDGAETEIAIEMRRAANPRAEEMGTLELNLPDAPFLIRVDGEAVVSRTLRLPIGRHQLEVEVTDRRPYQGAVDVPAARTVLLRPPLAWTLEAREDRLAAARSQRLQGIAMALAGGVAFLGATPVLIWNEGEIASTDEQINRYSELSRMCNQMAGPDCEMYSAAVESLVQRQGPQDIARAVTIPLVAVGGAVAAIGLVLWLSADSDEEIDQAARARLEVGPGHLRLRGEF